MFVAMTIVSSAVFTAQAHEDRVILAFGGNLDERRAGVAAADDRVHGPCRVPRRVRLRAG